MKQQKEETGKDSPRTSQKTRTSEKNEETIKEHDQKLAMKRNILFQQALIILQGWLVVTVGEASHE
jgi:hypothetical protein